jgi:peptidoglycan-N-acetylglucosamine deacetylase
MRWAAFTVDVDRDVNEPRKGAVEATCRGSTVPRYDSTLEGLEALVDMLDELGVHATFFMEGQAAEHLSDQVDLTALLRGHEVAAHGYAHEDLTGESTGVVPSEEWLDALVGRSMASVEDLVGRRPRGFRAPYQHVNDLVLRVLARRGFAYDSTLFGEIGQGVRPYHVLPNLVEVPLSQGRDGRGNRIQSYLWALHEGRRQIGDYAHLMSHHDEGLMVLADHSWHVAESLSGERGGDRVGREIVKVREVLQAAIDTGIEFMTVDAYLREVERL